MAVRTGRARKILNRQWRHSRLGTRLSRQTARLTLHRMATAKLVALVVCLAAMNIAGQQRPPSKATSTTVFKGEVTACDEFNEQFGPDLIFRLRPEVDAFASCLGWTITVNLVSDSKVDLCEMDVPNHGPSALKLFAWMFAPGESIPSCHRPFHFSTRSEAPACAYRPRPCRAASIRRTA